MTEAAEHEAPENPVRETDAADNAWPRPARARPEAPPEVKAAADLRAEARAAGDFQEADRLRGEIEAAGWKVIDRGTSFRLQPAHPPDIAVGSELRYGRSDAVPSRLTEPDTGPATVIVVAREDAEGAARAVRSVLRHEPAEVDIVLVADGLADGVLSTIDLEAIQAAAGPRLELIRTSAPLGQGSAWNIGLRRARGAVIAIIDASISLRGPVTPALAEALAEPDVAVAGPWGLVSSDLRRFEEVDHGDTAAIEAYVMAFRRSDAVARGPIDERFRFYRNLDVWWSLMLRDDDPEGHEDETGGNDPVEAGGEGLGSPGTEPRRAVVVPGLRVERHEHRAWLETKVTERDRLSKRNFYRVLDRFGARPDLAVPRPG